MNRKFNPRPRSEYIQGKRSNTIKVTRIHFTTTEGPDATEFDTQDTLELLQLFHGLLTESKLELISVDGMECFEEQEGERCELYAAGDYATRFQEED